MPPQTKTRKFGKSITILMADDNLHDCKITQVALKESRLLNNIRFVHSGKELLDYLRQEGDYTDEVEAPRPGLILLDLRMPGMDGRTALKEIKSSPELRGIPVAVLTLSNDEADVSECLEMGADAYLVKPVRIEALVDILPNLGKYWLEIVEQPPD
jgi:two-component system response regulator